MKFLPNTLLLVVLTIGFRDIYANDWAQDRERLGTHFSKFLKTFKGIAVNACVNIQHDDVPDEQVPTSNAKPLPDLQEYEYVTNGETYTAFRDYTRKQIMFLWERVSTSSHPDLLNFYYSIRDAIRVLAEDINEDPILSDEYKFERIPNLDYFETICVRYIAMQEEKFLEMCPLSPVEDSHNTSVNEWVQERERLGTHFLKFLETLQEIVLDVSKGRDREEVVHKQVTKHYGKDNLSDSEKYGYAIHGKNYTAFRNYTRTQIMFLWNRTPLSNLLPSESELPKTRLSIMDAIRVLAKDINEDPTLLDKYKFEKLPYREYFQSICVQRFKETEEKFLEICPSSPPKK